MFQNIQKSFKMFQKFLKGSKMFQMDPTDYWNAAKRLQKFQKVFKSQKGSKNFWRVEKLNKKAWKTQLISKIYSQYQNKIFTGKTPVTIGSFQVLYPP